MSKARIALEVIIDPIPEPGQEFIDWCEAVNVDPFGDGSEGRRGWCSWMGEYIRDNDCIVRIAHGSISGAFFAKRDELDILEIKELTDNA